MIERVRLLVLIVAALSMVAASPKQDELLRVRQRAASSKQDELIRIRERAVPFGDEKIPGLIVAPPAGEGLERRVAAQVSDSTITDYMTRLVDFQTRYSCTDSLERAAEWIHGKFLEFGFTDVSYDSFYFEPLDCDIQRSVVAVKQGALTPEKVIVVGGHYDSYTTDYEGCDPEIRAPGADDDASGTVATMEAARVLAAEELERTVIFIAFGGEEYWMWGSYHFAEEAFNAGMDITVMFNMDMVSNVNDAYWDIDLWAPGPSLPYGGLMAEMAQTYTGLIPVIYDGELPGDAIPFWEYGYRAVYAAETDFSPWYHTCDDVVQNVSLPYLTDATEMLTATILRVSAMPEAPAGFTALNIGDGASLALDWEANGEPDLVGYRIHYGTAPGEYDSLKTVSSPGDTLQNLAEGTTYYIAVSAFDEDGYESLLSDEAAIEARSAPQAPAALRSRSLETSVELAWEPVESDLDIARYRLYRKSGTGGFELLGSVEHPQATFVDESPEPHVMYSYHVTAQDSEDPPEESGTSNEARGRLATRDMGILVVDNTADGPGTPFYPTDEQVDDFYGIGLDGYAVTAEWDADDSAAISRSVMDYDVGVYSSVVWHSDVRTGTPMAPDTVTMRRYLELGGNLWLSGWMLISSLTGESGPSYFFAEGSFVREYMGLDSARTTSNADTDFLGAAGIFGEFPSLRVDGEKTPLGGLFSMDVFPDSLPGSNAIYAYVSRDSTESPYHGLPVGIASPSETYGLIVTDFPLFFMEADDARSLVQTVMSLFGEPTGIGNEDAGELPRAYDLSQNFPNPFNPETTIRFEIPGSEETAREKGGTRATRLIVFDMRGRRVKILVDRDLSPGRYDIAWDGKNAEGATVPSGIYFYRIEAGPFTSTRKMLMVK